MNAVEGSRVTHLGCEVADRPRAVSDRNVLDLARDAGMTVMLDGCIGRERYHSVTGSSTALERFAQACRLAGAGTAQQTPDRTTLEQWARACEQGQSREVARAIRAWLRQSDDVGCRGSHRQCGGE